MKILSLDDLLHAARDLKLPVYELLVQQLESMTKQAGKAIAEHLGIEASTSLVDAKVLHGTVIDGLMVEFGPKHVGQRCPEAIENGDPGGEWE